MDRKQQVNWASLAGYAIAAGCLIWLFYDIRKEQILQHLRGIRWNWVAMAVVCDILAYFCQGWRWSVLLRPIGKLSPFRATQAVYIGLFVNEVTPLRAGEGARLLLASQWLNARALRVLPSLLLERLFDGIWLAVAIGLTALFVELPRSVARAADVFGVVVLGITAVLLVLIMVGPGEASGGPARLLRRIHGALLEVGGGGLLRSLLLSAPVIALQGLAFWLVIVAYRMDLSMFAGVAVFLIVHFGTMIPAAPGNIGTYQFFVVAGAGIFGVDKTFAAGFSIVVFFLLTFPLWVVGLWAVLHNGLSLSRLRSAGLKKAAGRD